MIRLRLPSRNERGIALIMTLLVLLVMSLLAAVLLMTINTERKIAGHELRGSQALNIAEAGVSEAIARLRNGDIALSSADPKAVAQIYLAAAGSVPAVGADTTAMETKQPAGQWLNYSSATKGPDVLTVAWKTDPGRTVIYKYDATKNPAVQTGSGMPILLITSTGHTGSNVRRIVSEVVGKPFQSLINAALEVNVDLDMGGNAIVCGYNHSAGTPSPVGEKGRAGVNSCMPYETGSGDLPGTWTTANTFNGGGAAQAGVPTANLSHQVGFPEPWEALSMSQAEFLAWIGPPVATEPAVANGLIYLDNNGVAQDKSGSFKFGSTTGEGLLWVDGDLTLNSWFTYRGLIYVEGDLKLNGSAWILGALIVKGRTSIHAAGGSTVLYSADTISQNISRYAGQYITLSWREVTP